MDMRTKTVRDQPLLIVFSLGDGLFGIKADLVQGVVKVSPLTPVHHAPDYILGIRNLRGRVVTVFDLQIRLGLGSSVADDENRVLIVEWQGEQIGLLVDRIVDTIPLRSGTMESPPGNLPGARQLVVLGVVRQDERLVAVLNMDSVLQFEQQSV